MEDKKLERVKEIITEDSPFFSLYSSTNARLEDLLHIPRINEAEPPSFREALKIYIISTGFTINGLSRKANIPPKSSLLIHILNNSGNERYRNSPYPVMSARHFLNLGLNYDEESKEQGRISVGFYNSKGELVLSTNYNNPNLNVEENARKYISESYQRRDCLEWKRYYIFRILEEQYKRLKKDEKTKPSLSLEGDAKMSRLMRIAKDSFGLIPLYLIPPVRDEEADKERIKKHLRRLSA